jgi:hypothetical protein
MDERTLEALKGSIAKWERMAAEGDDYKDGGVDDCPLCREFHPRFFIGKDGCEGCPVREKTGLNYCAGSPHEDYIDSDTDDEAQEFIRAELDFLRSLLPAEAVSAV